MAGSVVLNDVQTAYSGSNFEFAIPTHYFTSAISGLSYDPAVTFGSSVRLNLSQSLSYSVAGGQASYGSARLGIVSVAAVPEPATWAMMLVGFGMIGGVTRYRRRKPTSVSFA